MSDAGRKARWGVLGCAGIAADVMLPALLDARNAELYAIASRSEDKLRRFAKKFHPVKTYVGYDSLLDDPLVDVVYIPLPTALHCDWVIRACEKGKPVLCEKPMAMNAAEAERIVAAAKRAGVPVMEAFAYFHGPVYAKIKEVLSEGSLGEARYFDVSFTQLMRDRNNFRLQKSGGGALYDMGCYPVSFFRAITGEEPEDIQVMRTMDEESGVDIDALAVMRFPSGKKAGLYVSFESHWCTRNVVMCERGWIDIPSIFDPLDLANKSVRVITKDLRVPGSGEIKEYQIDASRNYALQMEQMSDVALGLAAPAIPLVFSVGNARVMDRLLGSI